MNNCLFDLDYTGAKELLKVKSDRTFRESYLPLLTEGYHYTASPASKSHKFRDFSSERLTEWQQIKHDPKLLRDTIAAWHESLIPKRGRVKRETVKSSPDSRAGISA